MIAHKIAVFNHGANQGNADTKKVRKQTANLLLQVQGRWGRWQSGYMAAYLIRQGLTLRA